MNGVDGTGYMQPPSSMARPPGPGNMMSPPNAGHPHHLKGMPPSSHPGMSNSGYLPPTQPPTSYPPTSITNQMQNMQLSGAQQDPGHYRGPPQPYGGPPVSMHPTSVPGPTPGYMNSQQNNALPPRASYPPTSNMPPNSPSMHSAPNPSSRPSVPPMHSSAMNRPQYPMSPHSQPQGIPNQANQYVNSPQSYPPHSQHAMSGHPPMPGQRPQLNQHPNMSVPPPMPNQQTLPNQPPMPGQRAMPGQPPLHGQPPMPNQQTLPNQPPMPGQRSMPGQPSLHGHPPMPGQPPMPNQHQPYGGPPQPYPNPPMQQQRKLDPDAMPNPTQVIEADKVKSGDPYRTDCPGAIPPLVTTDFSVEDCGSASPTYIRCATYSLPSTSDISNECRVPMAMSVKPLAKPLNEPPLQIVDMGPNGPIRCKRCKAYMCPQFKFIDGGRRFQCCMCCAITDTPPHYFNHVDHMHQRVDKVHRPELCKGSYELLVTKDYCKNDQYPTAPAYIFAIDVSYSAVKSGLVHLLCERLLSLLDNLPCEGGSEQSAVRVGFFTYDRTLHFYNLKSTLAQPQMLVVSDVSEIFVPLQDGFLVTLQESRHVIESLLKEIPEMFADTRESETVLGPVVSSAIQAMKSAGCSGKLFLFSTTMPTIDAPGKLKNRDDRKVIGTDKEKGLFSPAGNFYPHLAKECVDQGCCVDLFLFPNQYVDIATIGQLSQLTGGDIYKYNYFKPEVDGHRFITDLQHDIARDIVFDAIMRVRTSTGIRAVNFAGAMHMTNTTDVELAGLDCDKALSVELKHDDKISEELGAFVQVALLYTSVSGVRRLRVHNIHLAVCNRISDMYRSCEADVLINFFAKHAIMHGLQQGMQKTKEELIVRVATILSAYRKHCANPSSSGQLILPECLKLLPVYLNSVLKNDCIHSSQEISTDDRSYLRQLVLGMDVARTQLYFYPLLLPVGVDGSADAIKPVRCSEDRLKDTESFLLHNGVNSFLWIGNDVNPNWIRDVFAAQSAAQIDIDTGRLHEFDNPSSRDLCNLIDAVTDRDPRCSKLVVIRQRDKLEPWFRRFLVEDKVLGAGASYVDFLCHIHKEIRAILA